MTTDVSSSVSSADVVAPSADVSSALGHSQGTDFYAVDDLLTPDERAIRDRVRRIEFYELPKTISGKIRRVELRAREVDLSADPGGSGTEWRDDQFPELKTGSPGTG